MKKLLLFLAITFVSASAIAQETYEWNGVHFTMPAGSEVTHLDENMFESQGEGILCRITVFEDENVTPEAIGEALGEMAVTNGFKDIIQSGELRDGSLSGGFIKTSGNDAYAIFSGMIDEVSGVSLISVVVYGEGKEDVANSFVNSFVPAKK